MAVLLDGMFYINITPLKQTQNIQEYGKFIFRRFLQLEESLKYTYYLTLRNHKICLIPSHVSSKEETEMHPKVLPYIPMLLSTQTHLYQGHREITLSAGNARDLWLNQLVCHTSG